MITLMMHYICEGLKFENDAINNAFTITMPGMKLKMINLIIHLHLRGFEIKNQIIFVRTVFFLSPLNNNSLFEETDFFTLPF